ncbi:MAG: hypothetical protein ACFFFC_16790 [Candidatus Thorarchaeota archaeon]
MDEERIKTGKKLDAFVKARDRVRKQAYPDRPSEAAVLSYILKRGGMRVAKSTLVSQLSRRDRGLDVFNVFSAEIIGFHTRWGLDRKFHSCPLLHAHRFEDGIIIERSLERKHGYVERFYYIVEGPHFRAFAQNNFRKRK